MPGKGCKQKGCQKRRIGSIDFLQGQVEDSNRKNAHQDGHNANREDVEAKDFDERDTEIGLQHILPRSPTWKIKGKGVAPTIGAMLHESVSIQTFSRFINP